MNCGLPVLYSFRRCPYAIRARLAIERAGLLVELREVRLAAKPLELLQASPKGTVPVLVLADGRVIEQSLEIMAWALHQHDPDDWLLRRGGTPGFAAAAAPAAEAQREMAALIRCNDEVFKHHLDRYKYASRHPEADPLVHHEAALQVLGDWNLRLEQAAGADGVAWLLGPRPSLADLALLPFVRQFRLADPAGFDALPGLAALQAWLGRFLASAPLAAVMAPQEAWSDDAPGRPFPAGRLVHHLALAADWQDACRAGVYRRSTRGLSLEQVGFIHACFAHQLAATRARFYADGPELVLLSIDPARLTVPLRLESSAGSAELFPHIHGSLALDAVVAAEPLDLQLAASPRTAVRQAA